MKKITLVSLLFLILSQAKSQDSLTIAQLEPITYAFNIEKGVLTGEGAEFLIKEMSISQYVMIGEYHGSYRISEFTSSIIPIFDSLGMGDK